MTATDPYYEDDSVTLYHGDCLDVMASLPANSVDSVVTDPPYGLGFMGKAWDGLPPGEDWARECLRVLKPGGHLLAFGGTRTWHRLAVAVEDAGFEMRDSIAWLYGSGFPKSLDVSKAIDKAAGAEREVVGTKLGLPGYSLTNGNGDHRTYGKGLGNTGSGDAECAITAPATDDAARWSGWGTALKPAFEPIVVARKPLVGTVAQNVLQHGAGALNIDGCRVPGEPWTFTHGPKTGRTGGGIMGEPMAREGVAQSHPAGRWPANVILDEEMARRLDEQNSEPGSSWLGTRKGNTKAGEGYNDTGGASRFFYVAKAPKSERPKVDGIMHPTVKPLSLMRWLVRLVTPPGGIALDTFAGSGATVEAAILEGFRCIAIERETDYLPLIIRRIDRNDATLDFGGVA